MMPRTRCLVVIAALVGAAGCHGAGPVSPSTTIGERTIARMHAAYAGSWYHTLTF